MSECITWTTCPRCGELAAIGWLQETAVEFDCRAGCTVTNLAWDVQTYRLNVRRSPPFVGP